MDPSIVLADRPYSLADIRTQGRLDFRKVGERAWSDLTTHCQAKELRLYDLLTSSLDGIDRLRHTTMLEIVWANKVRDLAPLFRMEWLERLVLSDFPRLGSLDGIESLKYLHELDLSGNCGSLDPPLRLASLKPLGKLRKLTSLSIFNVRLQDNDISFIASAFPDLRSFYIWNANYEFAHLAFLAGRLNSQLEKPIEPGQRLNVPCSKCGGALYRFAGYRMPTLCEACDKARFRNLTAEFARLGGLQ
ncbi:MAG TPA: hypothetical protein VKB38_21790 [Terracidiphilus sp.]|nr:hypothetical protein [Terracidiphilus sp.]